MSEAAVADANEHIRRFRARASNLQRWGNRLLIASFAVIVASVAIILLAGKIVSIFDVPPSPDVAPLAGQIRSGYENFANKVEALYRSTVPKEKQQDFFFKEIAKEREIIRALADKDASTYDFGKSFLSRVKTDALPVEFTGPAKSLLDDPELQSLQTKKDTLAAVLQASSLNPKTVVISAQFTRFGILVFLGMLVTLLAAQYRYNLRLAAYYDARADALDLMNLGEAPLGKRVAEFEALTAALTPSGYNFGKDVATPIDEVVEVAKYLTRKDDKKPEK